MKLLYILGIKYYNNWSILYIGLINCLYIYNIIINHNWDIIYKSIHFYTQYICALFYLYNPYIYDTFLIRKNIRKCINIFSSFNLLLSIIFSVIEFLYINDFNKHPFNILCNILFNIYGINILLLNFLIFYICFIKILQDLYDIYNKIIHENTFNCIKNIIEIKYTINETINNLEYVFNIFTFWGILILCINALDLDNINNEFYYSKFIFQAILQLIGHIILLSIKNYRVKIYNLIHNKFFINKFIIKLNKESLENIFNIPFEIQEYTNEMLFNSIEDNHKSIEWLIYNEILDKNWIEFSFMGFHIHNMEFIKKTILIISIITYIYNFVF